MTVTSRCATWDSSWASTPSSSRSSSRRMMPVVAQTTACFGERPVANALGTSVSAIATFGLGMSASAHSRSTIAVQLGRLLRRDLAAAHAVERDPVGEEPLRDQEAADEDQPECAEVVDEHRAEHDEQQAEQEHRQAHPGDQPAVGAVAGRLMAGHLVRQPVASVLVSRGSGPRRCRRAAPGPRRASLSVGGQHRVGRARASRRAAAAQRCAPWPAGRPARPGTPPRRRPRRPAPARGPGR